MFSIAHVHVNLLAADGGNGVRVSVSAPSGRTERQKAAQVRSHGLALPPLSLSDPARLSLPAPPTFFAEKKGRSFGAGFGGSGKDCHAGNSRRTSAAEAEATAIAQRHSARVAILIKRKRTAKPRRSPGKN
jgi:hypothetical protein